MHLLNGRLLLGNVLLATELVNDYQKPAVSSRSAVKLDISKAFDTGKWSFVESTLRAMHIPDLVLCSQSPLTASWRIFSEITGHKARLFVISVYLCDCKKCAI